MTETREHRSPATPADPPTATAARAATRMVLEICPYLRSDGGSWRSRHPAREHRCTAVAPPASPATGKQRSLCLVADHVTCAAYEAARRSQAAGIDEDGGPDLWPAVRSVPVVLESGRGILAGSPRRSGGQVLLGILMVAALVTLVLSRATGIGPGASPSPSPSTITAASASPSVTAPPSPTATPIASPTATPAPSPTPSSSPKPTATPIPSGAQRYTVKSGDTLSVIAARFGTTVAAITAANNITDPRLIRPGQVLIIP